MVNALLRAILRRRHERGAAAVYGRAVPALELPGRLGRKCRLVRAHLDRDHGGGDSVLDGDHLAVAVQQRRQALRVRLYVAFWGRWLDLWIHGYLAHCAVGSFALVRELDG